MRLTSLGLLLILASATESMAQVNEGAVGAEAIRATTIGALMPLMSPSMISRRLGGLQAAVRYGVRERLDEETQTYALAAILSIGLKASAALTAALVDPDCEPCESNATVGLGGDRRMFEMSGVVGSGSALSVALSGEFAWAQMTGNDSGIAGALGTPITLTLTGSGEDAVHFVSFLNPVFGAGRADRCPDVIPSCDAGGTRWLIGGGLGFWNPMTRISASIGVNYIMQEHEKPVFGLTVIYGGR